MKTEILDLDEMTDEEVGIQYVIEWVRVKHYGANNWFLGVLADEVDDRIDETKKTKQPPT